jgi:hypothetical protein
MNNSRQPIRIGNGAGFWGDNLDAPIVLANSQEIDVLTLEYLAELTLAILAHLRSKDPKAGYVNDFPELLERLIPSLLEQPNLSIVTNAGGLNPTSCAIRCGTILDQAGLGAMRIAMMNGDDVLAKLAEWTKSGINLDHMETGEPITSKLDLFVSANAYLGAQPIAQSCAEGARIVVTGRVADASLTLGPAAAHFGWSWDDMKRLAGASVAGHLIECGAQATGGLWHQWDQVADPSHLGYPIALVEDDGSSTITKPAGSGGLVTVANVAEQLVYEIDDPRCYRTPDVNVDLTTVSLTESGHNCVRVTGATGQAPSGKLKIAAVYRDGWTSSAMVAVVGRNAAAKARVAGKLVLDRVRAAGVTIADSLVEVLGANDVAPGVVPLESSPFEVVLRVSVRDSSKSVVERFCREMAPLVTSGPPGMAGYASGRPSPRPAFGYWPTLVDAALVPPSLKTRTAREWAEEGRA